MARPHLSVELDVLGWAALLLIALVASAYLTAPLPIAAAMAARTLLAVGGVTAWLTFRRSTLPQVGARGARALLSALLVGAALSGFGAAAAELVARSHPTLQELATSQREMLVSLLRPGEPDWIPVVVLVVALLPGTLEELLFRGHFHEHLHRRSTWTRVGLVGVLFAVVHMNPLTLLPLVAVGVVLGLLADRAGGWGAPAVAHVALNAISGVLLIRLPATLEPSTASLVVGGALCLFVATAGAFAAGRGRRRRAVG